MKHLYFLLLLFILVLSSCISSKKYTEQKSLTDKYLAEKNDCNDKVAELNASQAILKDQNELLQRRIEDALNDSIVNSKLIAKLKRELESLQNQIEILNNKENEILTLSTKERQQALQELIDKQKDITQKELSILKIKEELSYKDKRLRELERQLAAKDSTLKSIKEKLKEALSGFSLNEFSITEKDGKLYLSFSDKILFSTGSYLLDAKGTNVLKRVSDVLSSQKGIEIIVEGHTDNVTYKSSGGAIKDNWDLSVLRATTVCRTMVSNGVDPKKIIASGHAEYNPIAENASDEGKAKNRRTEIILSPDLKGVFNLLNKGFE